MKGYDFRSTIQTGRAYSNFTEVDYSFILADRAFFKIEDTNDFNNKF